MNYDVKRLRGWTTLTILLVLVVGHSRHHDALIYLTAKSCQDRLQAGIRHRFIGPVLDCNAGTAYEGRNVGNSPEMMPLDCSLFADLTHALSVHCAITSSIDPKSDSTSKAVKNLKFSMATPNEIQSAIQRLWPEIFKNNSRIKNDINKVLVSMKIIISHKGGMVAGIGNDTEDF